MKMDSPQEPLDQSLEKTQNKGKGHVPSMLAEIGGTSIIMFIGCMGCGDLKFGPGTPAFTFAVSVQLAIEIFGGISGGHFNPAVSLAVLIMRKINLTQFFLYTIAQFIGCFIGYAFLYAINISNGNTCVLKLGENVTPFQGFLVEALVTAALVMNASALSDSRNGISGNSTPLRVGFMICGLVYAAGPYSGAALNPARSLPPSLLNNFYDNHWVFHLGPFAGGALGGLIYRYVYDSEERYSLCSVFNSNLVVVDSKI